MRVEALEKIWVDKTRYDNAEKQYYEGLSNLDGMKLEPCANTEVLSRIASLEAEAKEFKQSFQAILNRLTQLENHFKTSNNKEDNANVNEKVKDNDDDDNDSVDLFGSDSEEEDAEHIRIREERLAKYAEKKATKTVIIAKSSILLDVKPWDDETDLKVMEAEIRKITLDGLLWGASKFVPVAFGIQKLTISCVVEDEKVSLDWLTEEIEKIDELVQSVDIAAFNKI
ncbi:probable elongation factor 1-delta isoform X2 [Drosophila innubila]|uniref:probable elongation factor 1-delta isoform X2 n=1 Tax=Drosophila innubila TaxID=198719 RepID=UPI00148D130F|nr:probable elongation factor 1-delta isoform X2 [Drosophila innubila]